MLTLLGLATDPAAAESFSATGAGRCWVTHDCETGTPPYRAVFAVATDQVESARVVADVALHVAYCRMISPATEPTADRVIASFGLIHHPDLDHRAADDHWRDVHAPLALVHHAAMCDYEQLSVVATLAGEPLDGLAMCGFLSRSELSERFFNDDASRERILADVRTFADMTTSWPRVVLRQVR